MNWKFWKKNTPAAAEPSVPVALTFLETRSLANFIKKPEAWSLRRWKLDKFDAIRADSQGLTYITAIDGVGKYHARFETHAFTTAFAKQWHEIAEERLSEKEKKEIEAREAALLQMIDNTFGEAFDRAPRKWVPQE